MCIRVEFFWFSHTAFEPVRRRDFLTDKVSNSDSHLYSSHLMTRLLQCVLRGAALEDHPEVTAGSKYSKAAWVLLIMSLCYCDFISCISYLPASGCNSKELVVTYKTFHGILPCFWRTRLPSIVSAWVEFLWYVNQFWIRSTFVENPWPHYW